MCADWKYLTHMLLRVERFPLDRFPSTAVKYSHEVDLYRYAEPAIEAVGPNREASVCIVTNALLDRFPAKRVLASESWPGWDGGRCITLKAFRYAYALATGRLDMIPRHERRLIRSLLVAGCRVPDYAAVAKRALAAFDGTIALDSLDGTPLGQSDAVEFRYPWRAWSGHGNGDTRYAEASAFARLHVIQSNDAPIVLELCRPDESGPLPIRLVEGFAVRPILAPGSWRPIDVQEFREAVGDGRAWADNPFLSRQAGPSSICLSVDDVVGPVRRENRRDVQAREDAEADCLQRAGDLFVIDGIVYKSTMPPRLHLIVSRITDAIPSAWDARISLAWSLSGPQPEASIELATWIDQDTLRSRSRRECFHVDWPSTGPARLGFAAELQGVLCMALTAFGYDDRNPGLRVSSDPVLLGEVPPTDAEMQEASVWAKEVSSARTPNSTHHMSTAEMWRTANETSIRRALAEALTETLKRTIRDHEEEMDMLASI
ncbi:hypothetical protein P7D22_22135 [Lichenihabitans sp. Uapishka_5]|uniref:hypothetical protein n=1 Tax=Lichenihabitans sp. Uapishka_5 TaxID=3037302 RepID=UPI0029E7ECB9|nr:hypothetical protein [Lichenihabitans sp. Uapishka_5]MDX7953858.1 hypothetical protein [Lichenihabitans sp. Uapishka_5]